MITLQMSYNNFQLQCTDLNFPKINTINMTLLFCKKYFDSRTDITHSEIALIIIRINSEDTLVPKIS